MSDHDYCAETALEVLMRKLQERDPVLAGTVQSAIDVGKDVSEQETSGGRRRKPRFYRRTVPFGHEEALQVELNTIRACFVETTLFINSSAEDFKETALGVPHHPRWFLDADGHQPISEEQGGTDKLVEIELQTETQITRAGEETMVLKPVDKHDIEAQLANSARLEELTDFT
jgi:hypothetical protein